MNSTTPTSGSEFSDISLDKEQNFLLEFLQTVADSFNKKKFMQFLLSKFSLRHGIKGVYLYGDVGRGKTMLMKMFYEKITVKKEIIHFQNFMQAVHQNLHKFQSNKGADKVIQSLADDIAGRVEILCIDEFEVKDITDAMIIMRLFLFLSARNVFIFLTTNTKPDNLYLNGLQREAFLPFIENIKMSFKVLCLDTLKDYRYEKVSQLENKIFFPLNDVTAIKLKKIKENLCSVQELYPGKFKVFGREVIFTHTHQNILFTEFDELFLQDFGYTDYVNLCQRFNIIVLENVRKISEDETDIITRFINFIDNAYFYKIILFASLEAEPALIYEKGKRRSEFSRAISRINEMDNTEYFSLRSTK